MSIRTTAALAAIVGFAPMALASVFYDEAIDGDMSDDRFNPNVFNLGLGSNTIISETLLSNLPQPEGDRDFFTVVVGVGQTLSQIVLTEASNPGGGFDSAAFVAMQFGPIITVDPENPFPNAGDLSGFILTTSDLIGTDVMAELSGLDGPLGPGEYAFWVQQTGEDLTRVGLEFTVIPAPGAIATLGLGALLAGRRRR